ncbi:MAG: hypothetical protein GXP43_03345 [bacterium]|nr:hypothetical protein [bacterium]
MRFGRKDSLQSWAGGFVWMIGVWLVGINAGFLSWSYLGLVVYPMWWVWWVKEDDWRALSLGGLLSVVVDAVLGWPIGANWWLVASLLVAQKLKRQTKMKIKYSWWLGLAVGVFGWGIVLRWVGVNDELVLAYNLAAAGLFIWFMAE